MYIFFFKNLRLTQCKHFNLSLCYSVQLAIAALAVCYYLNMYQSIYSVTIHSNDWMIFIIFSYVVLKHSDSLLPFEPVHKNLVNTCTVEPV